MEGWYPLLWTGEDGHHPLHIKKAVYQLLAVEAGLVPFHVTLGLAHFTLHKRGDYALL